jgi:hypothetical protein
MLLQMVTVLFVKYSDLLTQYKGEFDGILSEIADVGRRLGRLYDAIETGKVTLNDLSEWIQSLKQRKERLQARKWELTWLGLLTHKPSFFKKQQTELI